jgi:hypothetical protein
MAVYGTQGIVTKQSIGFAVSFTLVIISARVVDFVAATTLDTFDFSDILRR